MHVVLLAHGSRDPRHAATVEEIAAAVTAHLGTPVGAAYLDHCPPSLTDVLDDLPTGAEAVVVPLLLTSAFHARVDVPSAVAAVRTARPDLTLATAGVLGPDPAVGAALRRRVADTGVDLARPGTVTLLVAAGSSDAGARAEVAAVARSGFDAHAFASGEGPDVASEVRRLVAAGSGRIVLAQYLLAPGVLPDRAVATARATAEGLDVELVVAEPLGAAAEIVHLIARRARGAAS